MPYYTPLRYPGGKRRLTAVIIRLLEENRLKDVEYVEPYAGGASVALSLLLGEYASRIHINDLSRPIYAFWHTVLNNTSELCKRIEQTPVTLSEWYQQRAVYDNREGVDLTDLGFATLFLNRTNRSGIISGGMIGGKAQTGDWTLDVRFNKDELIQRIRRIGRFRSRIKLYQLDALDFTKQVISGMDKNTFVFYDPPYIEKGKDLYLNTYTIEGHRELSKNVAKLKQPWIVTYDSAAINHGLYKTNHRLTYQLSYSTNARYEGNEVMFFSKKLRIPAEWNTPDPCAISGDARNRYPIYGKMEA